MARELTTNYIIDIDRLFAKFQGTQKVRRGLKTGKEMWQPAHVE